MRGRTPSAKKCHSWQKLFFLVFDFSRVKFRTIFFLLFFFSDDSLSLAESLLKWLKVFFSCFSLFVLLLAAPTRGQHFPHKPGSGGCAVVPRRIAKLFSPEIFKYFFLPLIIFLPTTHNPSTHAQRFCTSQQPLRNPELCPPSVSKLPASGDHFWNRDPRTITATRQRILPKQL